MKKHLSIGLAALLCWPLALLSGADKNMNSTLAGSWYDNDPAALRKTLGTLLDQVKEPHVPQVMALIVPHAAYQYSGAVAASAYQQLTGRSYKRVIVLGPSHYGLPGNVASIPDFTSVVTPLGKIELDLDAIRTLRQCPMVGDYTALHLREHADQIQLPFLQMTLKDFKLIPILLGPLDPDGVQQLADALSQVAGPDTLIVASSDFTHYGSQFQYLPFPAGADIPAEIKKLDYRAFAAICARDPDGFTDFLNDTNDTICGRDAILTLLTLLPKKARPLLIQYDTSGRQTNNFAHSVSYASFVVPGVWPKIVRRTSESDRRLLLQLARKTIVWYLKNRSVPTPAQLGITPTEGMTDNRGVFVTLHENGQLRGCVGEIYPNRPLFAAVIAQSINAAVNDTRFPPVTAAELPKIDIEISVLTPPTPIFSWTDIVLGRDGIILNQDTSTAVFLPQVPIEQHWDLTTTLSQLAMKAGLPPDAWQNAQFMVFQADVFGEKAPDPAPTAGPIAP